MYSYHHNNTEKIARVMASVLDCKVKTPQDVSPEELPQFNLVGFGSGIYGSKHHPNLLGLIDSVPIVRNKNAFIFSTCGAPAFAVDGGHINEYVETAHRLLKERLQLKGYTIIDEFMCPGFNTNSFLKFFGGINKGRPNDEDLRHAKEFAMNLKLKLPKE